MMQVGPGQVKPALRALFDPGDPASLRCFAVLEGNAAGRIFTDDPDRPSWGVVQEAAFGSLYFGGTLDKMQLSAFINRVRIDSDVLVGLWPGDSRFAILPNEVDYDGRVLDFTGRLPGIVLEDNLATMPERCEIKRIDSQLFQRCRGRKTNAAIFGGAKAAMEKGFGLCLMHGDNILSEAFAGPTARGMIEISAETGEDYRQRGYATRVCTALIRMCESSGYQTYWNTATQNLASAALARKLGYRVEREYCLVAWFRSRF